MRDANREAPRREANCDRAQPVRCAAVRGALACQPGCALPMEDVRARARRHGRHPGRRCRTSFALVNRRAYCARMRRRPSRSAVAVNVAAVRCSSARCGCPARSKGVRELRPGARPRAAGTRLLRHARFVVRGKRRIAEAAAARMPGFDRCARRSSARSALQKGDRLRSRLLGTWSAAARSGPPIGRPTHDATAPSKSRPPRQARRRAGDANATTRVLPDRAAPAARRLPAAAPACAALRAGYASSGSARTR